VELYPNSKTSFVLAWRGLSVRQYVVTGHSKRNNLKHRTLRFIPFTAPSNGREMRSKIDSHRSGTVTD